MSKQICVRLEEEDLKRIEEIRITQAKYGNLINKSDAIKLALKIACTPAGRAICEKELSKSM